MVYINFHVYAKIDMFMVAAGPWWSNMAGFILKLIIVAAVDARYYKTLLS